MHASGLLEACTKISSHTNLRQLNWAFQNSSRRDTVRSSNESDLEFWVVFKMVVKNRLSWTPHQTIWLGERLVSVFFVSGSYRFCVRLWKSTQGIRGEALLVRFCDFVGLTGWSSKVHEISVHWIPRFIELQDENIPIYYAWLISHP